MKIEIYRRPCEIPYGVLDDKDIRIFYNGQWFDFRDGNIKISLCEPVAKKQVNPADGERLVACEYCGKFDGHYPGCQTIF